MRYALLIYSDETIWEKMTDAQRGQYVLGEPLDAALALAAHIPSAEVGSIEARPIPAYGG